MSATSASWHGRTCTSPPRPSPPDKEPTMTTTKPVNPDLAAQRAYAQRMVSDGFDFGLTHTQAFVRGIRDLGYRSSAAALDEEVDNADQADAKHVHVFWDEAAKPTWIAVADDG